MDRKQKTSCDGVLVKFKILIYLLSLLLATNWLQSHEVEEMLPMTSATVRRNMLSLISKLALKTLMANSLHGESKMIIVVNGVESPATTKHVIDHRRLRGEISDSLVNLSYLNHLDLSSNYFNGTIHKSIGSLTQLRYLDLSKNFFLFGTIPSEIGNLTNLRNISLGSWNLERSCTIENGYWLSNLSSLQHLEMDKISLAKSNHWIDAILSLQKLYTYVMRPYSLLINSSSSSTEFLSLRDNNLNSSMHSWLFPLTSNRLRRLDLSMNMLDAIPKYLGDPCILTSLSFFSNSALPYKSWTLGIANLSDGIQNFSSLKSLDLRNNSLNGSMSEKMWELPHLESLDVSSNSLTGPCKLGTLFPKWIQTPKNLTHLDIANTRISDAIPYLNLSSNNISGEVSDLSSNFGLFSKMDLSSNEFYGPIPNVPRTLISLNLSRNKFYGGISLCQIVDGFLSFLDLAHC
ncbi:hypothetical protein OSB04_017536 [Centaurea solstitialis]|uniref:Uncharacterized protein n=1 Tax=Centaurea solstitialis TaxID=347529 RepID=A0AA38WM37_9ASTR|nr:hypothetical protein OSB04_017536 [Centaurea solstitialis]